MFKEEEEAIKVDLHEGCGRTKLFWLMALADSKTMKAMVEFREHTGNRAYQCLCMTGVGVASMLLKTGFKMTLVSKFCISRISSCLHSTHVNLV